MGAPATLPADFFDRQAAAPATLPAGFFDNQPATRHFTGAELGTPGLPRAPLPSGLEGKGAPEESFVPYGGSWPHITPEQLKNSAVATPYAGPLNIAEGVGQVINAPTMRGKAAGVHQTAVGAFQTAAPAIIPAAIAAPVATAAVVGAGMASQAAVEKGLKALGAPKEYADVAGDFAGILAGWGAGKGLSALRDAAYRAQVKSILQERYNAEYAARTAGERAQREYDMRPKMIEGEVQQPAAKPQPETFDAEVVQPPTPAQIETPQRRALPAPGPQAEVVAAERQMPPAGTYQPPASTPVTAIEPLRRGYAAPEFHLPGEISPTPFVAPLPASPASAPDVLPADHFEQMAQAPDVLPAEFFDQPAAPIETPATPVEAPTVAENAAVQPEAARGVESLPVAQQGGPGEQASPQQQPQTPEGKAQTFKVVRWQESANEPENAAGATWHLIDNEGAKNRNPYDPKNNPDTAGWRQVKKSVTLQNPLVLDYEEKPYQEPTPLGAQIIDRLSPIPRNEIEGLLGYESADNLSVLSEELGLSEADVKSAIDRGRGTFDSSGTIDALAVELLKKQGYDGAVQQSDDPNSLREVIEIPRPKLSPRQNGGTPSTDATPRAGAPVAEPITPAEGRTPLVQEDLKGGGPLSTSPAVAPTPAAGAPSSRGAIVTVKTPSQTRAKVRYQISEADDLKTSFDEGYNADFQPRNTDRIGSRQRIEQRKLDMDPEAMGYAYEAGNGAPITSGGMIVTRNHGIQAVKELYGEGKPKAQEYRDWVTENAGLAGMTPEQVQAMKRPILHRELMEPWDAKRIAKFAQEANASSTARMSEAEVAEQMAKGLTSAKMDAFQPNEDGIPNPEFVRGLIVDLPSEEQAQFFDKNGELSQAGARMARNAIFAKAYPDRAAIERMSESTDTNVRNITNGMLRAANDVAKMTEGISRGDLHDLSIAPEISRAAGIIDDLRTSHRNVQDWLNQEKVQGRETLVEYLVGILSDEAQRPKVIADTILNFAHGVNAIGSPKQESMFAIETPTRLELLEESYESAKREADAAAVARRKPRGQESLPVDRPGDAQKAARAGEPDQRGIESPKSQAQNRPVAPNSARGPYFPDPTEVARMRGSIAEGEMILKSGKKQDGTRYSPAEMNAILRSVKNTRARLAEYLKGAQ